MQGNSGGGGAGGAALLGYMIAKHPAETGVAFLVMGALALGGMGIHAAAVHFDQPDREPIASAIVEESLRACANARTEEGLYSIELKNGLMAVWSSNLQEFKDAKGAMKICEDAALNDFVLPYNYDQVGTNYRGEYRVMGVHYTRADGAEAFVVKPKTDVRAANSIDDRPDSPTGMNFILDASTKVPDTAYRHVLPDGTKVAVFLQHDGVTQKEGSSTIHDNDGIGWADAERMEQILEHYNFAWPVAQRSAAAPQYGMLMPG